MSYIFTSLDSEQPRLGQIFADELRAYEWSSTLESLYSRLRLNDQLIFEAPDGMQHFANALWNLCFPALPHAELWHYTTLDNLANILRQAEIWLHPISKRMGEGELTEFATHFGYYGFIDVESNGDRVVDNFAHNLFYLSLTDLDNADDLWNYGDVRLRLRISPVQARADLRKMRYSIGSNHPLCVLKKFSTDRFGRHFLPSQVSRCAAFFLDSYYSWESEVRLLIKRFDTPSDLIIRESGGHEVVAVPLGRCADRVLIDLLHIDADTQSNLEKASRLVAASSFCDVSVSQYEG